MFVQAPLVFLSKKINFGKRFGNILFWIFLILGIPLIVYCYLLDWMQTYYINF